MKTGTRVQLVQPVIEGTVTQRRINPATDELELLVQWDEGGQAVARWFDADQLVPAAEVAAAAAPAAEEAQP